MLIDHTTPPKRGAKQVDLVTCPVCGKQGRYSFTSAGDVRVVHTEETYDTGLAAGRSECDVCRPTRDQAMPLLTDADVQESLATASRNLCALLIAETSAYDGPQFAVRVELVQARFRAFGVEAVRRGLLSPDAVHALQCEPLQRHLNRVREHHAKACAFPLVPLEKST